MLEILLKNDEFPRTFLVCIQYRTKFYERKKITSKRQRSKHCDVRVLVLAKRDTCITLGSLSQRIRRKVDTVKSS